MTLEAHVLDALRRLTDSSTGRAFVSAYQIFSRLPVQLQASLVTRHAFPGKGSGKNYSAASAVAAVLRRRRDVVEVQHLDTSGLTYSALGKTFVAGCPVCGLYRLARNPHAEQPPTASAKTPKTRPRAPDLDSRAISEHPPPSPSGMVEPAVSIRPIAFSNRRPRVLRPSLTRLAG